MLQKVYNYIGDLRDCPERFVVARTVEEVIYYLEKFDIAVISLDHDLVEGKDGNLMKNGYDLVKYICENGLMADKIYLHTDNPVGRDNMYYTLIRVQRRGFIGN